MELLSKNASFLSRSPGHFLISECKSTHFFNNCQIFWNYFIKKVLFSAKSPLFKIILTNRVCKTARTKTSLLLSMPYMAEQQDLNYNTSYLP